MTRNSLFKIGSLISISLALMVGGCSEQSPPPVPTPAPTPTPATTSAPKSYTAPPPITIDVDKTYTAIIETEKGDLVLELFAKDVPMTVNNFIFLARDGFYNNSSFHRVIPGFMAQGGDPTGTGTGSPGYKFTDEFSEHKHNTGTLSMANSGPNSNGCQFFITYAPQAHLDGKHSVFGQLTEGIDILQKIESGDAIKRITIQEA